MNNDVEVEGRPRPLSTGLWTLFSWLRRDDRSVSSESLSSAGSDRTVASFAFLTPARYQPARAPIVVPPPGPPTDSYKKRVHDRNLRRHHDRDITLHRKYGLFKSEGPCSYDAFSLPPVRRISADSGSRWDRDRRATSECYPRRLAHVPGKRRAPLPPVSAAGPSASLPRRYTRKRPAPQPPVRLLEKNKPILNNVAVNTSSAQMSSNTHQDKTKIRNNDVTMGCKSEKYSKKEASAKDTKTKPEKSFLKQIFDGKKRNSYLDTSAVKLLPSISELDKQAAAIIETCKLKATEQNNNTTFHKLGTNSSNPAESWFCIRCLRKYDSTVVTCSYCISKHKVQSSEIVKDNKETTAKASNIACTQTEKDLLPNRNYVPEDKQKLKEMLKEMKDSLPKRPKHDLINKTTEKQTSVEPRSSGKKPYSTETPTLRVGSIKLDENKTKSVSQPSKLEVDLKLAPGSSCSQTNPPQTSAQAVLVAQVISAYKKQTNNLLNAVTAEHQRTAQAEVADTRVKIKEPEKVPQKQTQDINVLNTPLKISSLLNPMYVPKSSVLNNQQSTYIAQKELKNEILSQNSNEIRSNVNPDKVHQISQNMSVPTSSSAVVAVPSTSQTSVSLVNDVKIENKTKTNTENCTNRNPNSSQTDQLIMPETRKVPEPIKPQQKTSKLPLAKEQNSTNVTQMLDQHSRRRDLINQLEKSIARGDERAAAEAAAKLAQLRLSCSVLSFSSQILSQPSTSSNNNKELPGSSGEKNIGISTTKNDCNKKEHIVPAGPTSSSVKEKSPPKVTVSQINPTAVVFPKKVTTSLVSKTETSKLTPVQKEANGNIHRKEEVPKKETPNEHDDNIVTIAVLVEDREATRGPVHLRINRQACIRDLRREAETSLGLATNLQRWIVGRALCVNDTTPIVSLAGPDFSAPFYLCVVESETKLETNPPKQNETAGKNTNDQQKQTGDVYTELMQLEQQALVHNAENFECGVCMEEYPPGQGVVLRECVHIFCKDCLSDVVRHCEEPDVPCPAMGCRGMLQEREIRALVPAQDYERWLARGLAAAESGTRNAFHCRTRDCKGWALCEPGVQRFPCPVCKCINCVPCQAIHDGVTCEQHRAKMKQAACKNAQANETDDGTRTLLNSLISKGEALECPECSAIITKKWGCDWVKCSACKTEICWVTRGRRWGPGGKGDTSGGCRCGVDGKRCHPSCGYCH